MEEDQGAGSGGVRITSGATGFESNCSFEGPPGEKSREANPASVVLMLDTFSRMLLLLRSRRCASLIRLAGRLVSSRSCWTMVAPGMVSRESRVRRMTEGRSIDQANKGAGRLIEMRIRTRRVLAASAVGWRISKGPDYVPRRNGDKCWRHG